MGQSWRLLLDLLRSQRLLHDVSKEAFWKLGEAFLKTKLKTSDLHGYLELFRRLWMSLTVFDHIPKRRTMVLAMQHSGESPTRWRHTVASSMNNYSCNLSRARAGSQISDDFGVSLARALQLIMHDRHDRAIFHSACQQRQFLYRNLQDVDHRSLEMPQSSIVFLFSQSPQF